MDSAKQETNPLPKTTGNLKVVALAGGVGGAKLVDGLAQVLPPDNLTVIVNTGDDFNHYGLRICPDLDTVCYTLAGLANPKTGWGLGGETWRAIEHAKSLGGPGWFNLGDRDLGTHLERTRRLQAGHTLTEITRDFCSSWGIQPLVLPMSDQPVRTIVNTIEYGELAFQDYFVHMGCEPRVVGFRFEGLDRAEAAPGSLAALKAADAVIFCPSNPWVSIDPILHTLKITTDSNRPELAIAVSPIIGGKTVKGPAAKMFSELGIQPSALAVADHYQGIIRGFVLDDSDSDLAGKIAIPTLTTDTLMDSLTKRAHLAQDVLNFVGRLL